MNTREKDAIRKRKQRKIWKENGLCISCGANRDTHRLKCSHCHKQTLKLSNRIREKRISQNICAECGKAQAINGYVVCINCLQSQRNRSIRNRENRLENARSWRDRVRIIVIEHYGGKCICCGEVEPLFLEIDHINNDGASHRKSVKGGPTFYRWLQKNNFPPGFQVLCRNCNYGKFRNNGVCPHKNK